MRNPRLVAAKPAPKPKPTPKPKPAPKPSPVPEPPVLRVVPEDEPAPRPESLPEQVHRELTARGVRWTSDGMLAVLLAERMEAAAEEPGTALAVLARQFHDTMRVALAAGDGDVDELDVLLSRHG